MYVNTLYDIHALCVVWMSYMRKFDACLDNGICTDVVVWFLCC
jgi:hypothetical protein